MRIQPLMDVGGGPSGDPGAGDAGGGSPSPSPGAAPVSSANPRLAFPDPDPAEGATPEPGKQPQAQAPSPFAYKRGDRTFKSQQELDSYLDEMERGGSRQSNFDPDRFRDELLRDIERRFRRGGDEDEEAGGQGQRGQRQQFQPEENPYDQETQPGQWAAHEVAQAKAEMQAQFQEQYEELNGQVTHLMTAQQKAELRSAYKSNFGQVLRDPRVARDVEPGMEDLLEHVVAIDPGTKDDFSNLPQQVSAWGRKLKSWADQREAKRANELKERGGSPVPSATRGAAAPVTRRPPQSIPNPGKLEGQDSTYNRLRRTFAGRAE